MARPTKKNEEVTMTATATDLPEVTESEAVEAEVTESEAVEAEATEPAPEAEIDLTEFIGAVQTAIAERDSATGVLPEVQIDNVRSQYVALDGVKAKNKAKDYLHQQLRSFMAPADPSEIPDVSSARAVMILQEEAAVAGRPGSPAKPKEKVDPTDAYAEGLTALTLAFYLATSTAPEGVDLDKAKQSATEKANELFPTASEVYASEDKATEDKVIASAIKLAKVKAPRKASSGGSGRVYTGTRRDIGKHIAEAIAGAEAGTFLSVADLRKFKSEEYGDDAPSAGAITNRLEPTSGAATSVPGVVVERRSVDGRDKLGVVVQ